MRLSSGRLLVRRLSPLRRDCPLLAGDGGCLRFADAAGSCRICNASRSLRGRPAPRRAAPERSLRSCPRRCARRRARHLPVHVRCSGVSGSRSGQARRGRGRTARARARAPANRQVVLRYGEPCIGLRRRHSRCLQRARQRHGLIPIRSTLSTRCSARDGAPILASLVKRARRASRSPSDESNTALEAASASRARAVCALRVQALDVTARAT